MAEQIRNVKTNTFALVGFILSFFLGIVGSILCLVGLEEIKKTGEDGKGLAIAGIIIGFIPLVLFILIMLLYIIILFAVFIFMMMDAAFL